jgi:hypothetical protein
MGMSLMQDTVRTGGNIVTRRHMLDATQEFLVMNALLFRAWLAID